MIPICLKKGMIFYSICGCQKWYFMKMKICFPVYSSKFLKALKNGITLAKDLDLTLKMFLIGWLLIPKKI